MKTTFLVVLSLVIYSNILHAEEKTSLEIIFSDPIYDQKGHIVTLDRFKQKMVALYFSASWCESCQIFTPKLLDYYHKNKSDMEVIFISSDQSPKDMKSYMKKSNMPWLYLNHKSSTGNWLEYSHEVYSIPRLILLNDRGEVIASDALSLVHKNIKAKVILEAEVSKETYHCKDCDEKHLRYSPVF